MVGTELTVTDRLTDTFFICQELETLKHNTSGAG